VNASAALARLQGLGVPALSTADAAAVLGLPIDAASHTLHRLSSSGLVIRVRKGLWAMNRDPDPHAFVEYVTAPYPSYLPLQTALYQRGIISQVSEVIYLVSLARRAQIRTSLGTYSVHHVQPEFFGGFETVGPAGVKFAFAEKVLVDFPYLSPARGSLFASLPEVERPRGFRCGLARQWAQHVPTPRLRVVVKRKLEEILQRAKASDR
jgi:predicted transcriptional regulator of viral defense system